ncbi:MAG: 4Fe-4S dicluster domain-containing protein [Chloroflexi bacterium]|nr:4Fe-4S dicluster domain-containing protein [Chloroflexota bacterium]
MKVVKFLAQVDKTKCVGDKLCEEMCPTGAIRVVGKKAEVDKKATVDSEKCLACARCMDRCQKDAVTMVPRGQPKVFGTSTEGVDHAKIRELCRKAHRQPYELVCVCTFTLAEEIAAAIIKGARSVREVALMTGVLSGCQQFCSPVIQRMLKAYGVDIAKAGAPLTYDQTFSLWDIPEEIQQKYPGYYFKEDAEMATRLRSE